MSAGRLGSARLGSGRAGADLVGAREVIAVDLHLGGLVEGAVGLVEGEPGVRELVAGAEARLSERVILQHRCERRDRVSSRHSEDGLPRPPLAHPRDHTNGDDDSAEQDDG